MSLQLVGSPPRERVVDQRVLNIDQGSYGRISPRQFLHGQDRGEEVGAGSTELLRNFDPHQTELEKLGEKTCVHLLCLIHLRHEWSDLRGREIPYSRTKHLLFVGEQGQRGKDRGIGLCERMHVLYLWRLDRHDKVENPVIKTYPNKLGVKTRTTSSPRARHLNSQTPNPEK